MEGEGEGGAAAAVGAAGDQDDLLVWCGVVSHGGVGRGLAGLGGVGFL